MILGGNTRVRRSRDRRVVFDSGFRNAGNLIGAGLELQSVVAWENGPVGGENVLVRLNVNVAGLGGDGGAVNVSAESVRDQNRSG